MKDLAEKLNHLGYKKIIFKIINTKKGIIKIVIEIIALEFKNLRRITIKNYIEELSSGHRPYFSSIILVNTIDF